jgi:MSHA pilin protein MshD
MKIRHHQRGITLIELIIFIVIVSIALVAVLQVLNVTVARSSDPMVRKQALSLAEGFMDEILSKDYQNDVGDAANISNTLGCTVNTTPACLPNAADRSNYNDVSDYAGWGGIMTQADGTATFSTNTYTGTVSVTTTTLAGVTAKQVVVSVTGGGNTITLTGFRTNYE